MDESTNIHCKANASTSSNNELILNIEEILRISKLPRSSKPCIYRVPEELRRWNQQAYTPQVIAIGPYHHGKKRYKSMEKLKVKFLKNFMGQGRKNVTDLVNFIIKLEGRVRDCYAEDVKFKRNDFVKIILMDVSFIVEFLTGSESVELLDPWLADTMEKDLRLLENQLPFFVIEELYNLLAASYGPNCTSFIELCLNFFGPDNIEILSDTPNLQVKHFLDLLRTLLVQPQRSRKENNDQGKKSCTGILKSIWEVKHCVNWLRTTLGPEKKRSEEEDKHLKRSTRQHEADNGNDQVESSLHITQRESRNQSRDEFHDESQNLPSVSQLHRAGVKLAVSSSTCLLKLEFIKGVLKIPKLLITDDTERVFRNIVAFEQRYYPDDSYVTNYTFLLDSLINNTEDVDLLVEKGIIVNWIGDNNAVSTLVNNLGINIMPSKETRDYYHLSQELKTFHNNRCHRWRAILARDYFSTPWRTAFTSAAVILLVLTFIQTVCSLLDLKHK